MCGGKHTHTLQHFHFYIDVHGAFLAPLTGCGPGDIVTHGDMAGNDETVKVFADIKHALAKGAHDSSAKTATEDASAAQRGAETDMAQAKKRFRGACESRTW